MSESSGVSDRCSRLLCLQRYAAIRQRIDINCMIRHLARSKEGRYSSDPRGAPKTK